MEPPLVVAIDDNYPPYIFRDSTGQLQGILKDTWELWSKRTGVPVRLEATDWAAAQKSMESGQADVIDTIFRTEARESIYDFSAPYATIDVNIFFDRDLSGITNAPESLRGFTVGVKDRDACIDWLQDHGITAITPYPSYETLIDAAARGDIKLFCIDRPPALHFIYKRKLEDRFRQSPPLYAGRFHWAVHKGDGATMSKVENGFARITAAEHAAIDERWLGVPLERGIDLESVAKAALAMTVAGLALLVWNWALRRKVASRTRSLAESEERFRTIFDNISDAVFIHHIDDGRILFVNQRMREMYHASELPVESLSIEQLSEGVPPYGTEDAVTWIEKARSGTPQTFEWHARTLDGRLFWAEVRMRRAHVGGIGDALLVLARDITERKAAQARMEFIAHHDPLTELPNRLLARDRYHQAVSRAERNGHKVAVLFIDLDHFKTINDSLGHPAGDALLQMVASRLTKAVRDSDTVSRQGGDEFLVLLADLPDTEAASTIAEKIVETLAHPLELHGQELGTSLSVGIAIYPDDGGDFDTLLKKADTALYSAKEAGRNTHRFFDERMNVDALEHLAIRTDLRRAVERQEFELHFQPQLDVATGKVMGAEALVRWRHPERGLMPPATFIPIAEDSGLIVPLGDWVLHEACRQAARWHAEGFPISVAVNLSALQFKRGNLEDSVRTALHRTGLPAAALELELTESILIKDTDKVLAKVRHLHALGVELSIDDFGTGYSSLSYLQRFQVDKLKIDQSFVHALTRQQDCAAIVTAVIQMAHSLNLKTIAEGVEDEDTLQALRSHGCDLTQGYLHGRPMPVEDFRAYLAARRG